MKSYRSYIIEFTAFAESLVEIYKPSADPNLTKGTIPRMASYMGSLGTKHTEYINALNTKESNILLEVGNNPDIDKAKLKEELMNIIVEHKNKFVKQYKPQ